MSGTLFIVATPIGNLDDLSPRARKTLAEVHLVAAEDTRHTGRLLSHIGVKTPLKALHEHNESALVPQLVATLRAGQHIALVSDAGTPLVSDPGYRLVTAARDAGLTVSPVPGPCALTAALSVAGLPVDRFCFEGFLPAKSAARTRRLQRLADEQRTLVFYESVHRIDALLRDLVETFGASRQAFIGRELTKMHEQTVRATLGDLEAQLAAGEITAKGEFVVIVEGAGEQAGQPLATDELLGELAASLPARKAARLAARLTGESANALYERIVALKD